MAGILRLVLVAGRSAAGVLLALLAAMAALATARFIQDVPDLRLEAEVARLIDASAVSDHPRQVRDIVDAYNASVRSSAGERLDNLTVKQLFPATAGPGTPINLDSAERYVAYSQDLGGWAVYTGTEIQAVPQRVAWTDIDGCDERVTVLDERYGPVVCLPPSGAVQPFGESLGVPGYARELARLELTPGELDAVLRTIERSQYLEARLVVFNDGSGAARNVQVAAPESFAFDGARVVERRCARSGLSAQESFPMPGQQHCRLVYRSTVPQPGSLDEASGGSLAFSVSASNQTWLADVPLNWLLVIAFGLTGLYFAAYVGVSWHERDEIRLPT